MKERFKQVKPTYNECWSKYDNNPAPLFNNSFDLIEPWYKRFWDVRNAPTSSGIINTVTNIFNVHLTDHLNDLSRAKNLTSNAISIKFYNN